MQLTNHRARFSHVTIKKTKKKAVAGKHCKNNKINKTLHSFLRHLETIKNDKNLHQSIGLNVTKKMPCRLKEIIHYQLF